MNYPITFHTSDSYHVLCRSLQPYQGPFSQACSCSWLRSWAACYLQWSAGYSSLFLYPFKEADEGLQKMPHFHTMTRSIAAKQRSKVRVPDVQQPELPLSFRMDKINTIEGILSGMKTRILGLEKNLVSQLDLKKQAGLISEKSLVAAVSGNASLAMPPQQ